MPTFDLNSVANNIVAALIFAALSITMAWVWKFILKKANKRFTFSFFYKLLIPEVFIVALMVWKLPKEHTLYVCSVAIVFIAFQFIFLRDIRKVGLIDAYPTTKRGIDYRSSLTLARNSMSFLGIGAHKLTSLPEFKEAIERCAQSGNVARFLLSPPENPLLTTLAQRHGAAENKYQDNVSESLRILAKLKREGFNIEVKHYTAEQTRDLQKFRLFIIDDVLCLVSWTVWTTSKGKDNPQVILKKQSDDSSVRSMASAFMSYFDDLWDDPSSKSVDLDTIE